MGNNRMYMGSLILNIIIFAIALYLLFLASDWLIHSSVKMAMLLRLSPLFIGLIFIAFGTSAPEAAVGIIASIENQGDIALGDIVGSSIANIGLVLGIAALIKPIKIDPKIFRREVPLVVFAAIVLFIFCMDLEISRIEGLLFLLCFIIFCVFAYNDPYYKQESKEELKDFKPRKFIEKLNSKRVVSLAFFAALLFVVLATNIMINSGVEIAKYFKISPWIIGLTLFAIGTSIPELAITWTAVMKKVPSISVGNIIGSDIFNILFVLGIAALIRPITINPDVLIFELPIMLVFILALALFMSTGHILKRIEGAILLSAYVLFIIILFLR
ncbi:MAG: calcium/sodium antiporter [Armatimonadota bacterium]